MEKKFTEHSKIKTKNLLFCSDKFLSLSLYHFRNEALFNPNKTQTSFPQKDPKNWKQKAPFASILLELRSKFAYSNFFFFPEGNIDQFNHLTSLLKQTQIKKFCGWIGSEIVLVAELLVIYLSMKPLWLGLEREKFSGTSVKREIFWCEDRREKQRKGKLKPK